MLLLLWSAFVISRGLAKRKRKPTMKRQRKAVGTIVGLASLVRTTVGLEDVAVN
jgi:hypothetical protein